MATRTLKDRYTVRTGQNTLVVEADSHADAAMRGLLKLAANAAKSGVTWNPCAPTTEGGCGILIETVGEVDSEPTYRLTTRVLDDMEARGFIEATDSDGSEAN